MPTRSVFWAASSIVATLACNSERAAPTESTAATRAAISEVAVTPPAAGSEPDGVPPPAVLGGPAIVALGVYAPDALPSVAVEWAAGTAKKRDAKLEIKQNPSDAPGLLAMAPPIDEFPPPPEGQLQYFGRGLAAGESAKVTAARGVLVMSWTLPDDPGFGGLRDAYALAHDAAKEHNGWIWDDLSRELFTREAWTARTASWEGDVPHASRHYAIHYYKDGERHRAVTLGLLKFGLPDLCIQDVPPPFSSPMGATMEAVVQTLVEGARVGPSGRLDLDVGAIRHRGAAEDVKRAAHEGAALRGHVTLIIAEREPGDAPNRLLEIRFAGYPGRTETEREGAFLSSFFGGIEDEPLGMEDHDAELAEIARRTQARLPALAAAVQKGLALGDRLSVKAPFDTDDGNTEWMWIAVSGWSEGKVRGTLDNDPKFIKSLRRGAAVSVKESSIADYVWRKSDGSQEGGASVEVVGRKGRPNLP